MHFKPCVNRNACTEDGTHCKSCGRSHTEILNTRVLINAVSAFMAEMEYDNNDEFLNYFVKKAEKKLKYLSDTTI